MRKLICTVLALALCLSLAVPAVSAAGGDEVKAAKKIISVVYDDSTSMCGDRWVYANYAMQALTALLNERDEMYITYMSIPTKVTEVDLSDIGGAVKEIRNWCNADGTPEVSMDTAKDKLDSIQETDVTTQFWLVILTDGKINDMNKSMQDKLNSFKGDKMSNGSALNVVYLAMGGKAEKAKDDTKNGLYTYAADSHEEIIDAMSEVANLVSGRLTAEDVKQVDETTISFTTELPLYNISVLSQGSAATVTGAASAETKLNVERNIPLDAFEPFGNSYTTLMGNAAVLNLADSSGSAKVLPADTYTITFSEPVDLDNVVIQYEPAIGLKLVVTKDGVVVDDTGTLQVGDKVNIEIIPVIPGTDTEIPASDLPGSVSWSVEYVVDDQVVDSGSGTKLNGITIRDGENMVRGTMQIPGFAPTIYEIDFSVAEIVYNFGIDVDQPDPLSYNRRTAADGSVEGGSVTFWLTNDGVRLTKEEQKSIGVELEITEVLCDGSAVTGFLDSFGSILAGCRLVRNDDGSYTLTPSAVVPFTAFLMKAGVYTVTVQVDRDTAVTAQGTFTMLAQLSDWTDLIGLLVVLLILLYLIYIFFIKYKFKGQTVRYEVFKLLGDGSGSEMNKMARSKVLGPLTGGLLLPKRACEVKFQGVVLQAGPDGMIIVTGKSIAKRVKFYGASGSDPESSLGSIVSSMHPTERTSGKKKERVAPDQTLSATRPVYFRTTDTDKQIWRVFLRDKSKNKKRGK